MKKRMHYRAWSVERPISHVKTVTECDDDIDIDSYVEFYLRTPGFVEVRRTDFTEYVPHAQILALYDVEDGDE